MTTKTQALRMKQALAHKWRLLQAATLLALFRRIRGRDATSLDELERWALVVNVARPIDPFAVLTADELEVIKQERPDLFDGNDKRW